MSRILGFILLTFISFFTATGQYAILNAGFENWDSNNAPEDWGIINISIPLVGDIITATKDEASHSGLYSILLQTKEMPILGFPIPGAVTTGSLNLISFAASGGMPYTQTPTILKGYYKYTPAGSDEGMAQIYLTHWNPDFQERDTIASGTIKFRNQVLSFTSFTVPIVYSQQIEPDSVSISFYSSDLANPVLGSRLHIDDLELYTPSLGDKDFVYIGETNPALFPNPASDYVFIKKDVEYSYVQLELWDILGKRVFSASNCEKDSQLDIRHLKNGLYIYILLNKEGEALAKGKISVNH